MKTTVKLYSNRSVVVHNAKPGTVKIDLCTFGLAAFSTCLTPDQAQVLGEALSLEATRAEALLDLQLQAGEPAARA